MKLIEVVLKVLTMASIGIIVAVGVVIFTGVMLAFLHYREAFYREGTDENP